MIPFENSHIRVTAFAFCFFLFTPSQWWIWWDVLALLYTLQKCPHCNPWNLWICCLMYITRHISEVIQDLEMGRVSWIIWVNPMWSQESLYKGREGVEDEENNVIWKLEVGVMNLWRQRKRAKTKERRWLVEARKGKNMTSPLGPPQGA